MSDIEYTLLGIMALVVTLALIGAAVWLFFNFPLHLAALVAIGIGGYVLGQVIKRVEG